MKRRSIALFALLALCCSFAIAKNNNEGAQKKALGAMMKAYWPWFLGASQTDHIKNVVFIPLPVGTPDEDNPHLSVGEISVTLHPGDSFALPIFSFTGETYLEDIDDDPPGFPPQNVFTENAQILVKLDGKTVIDSRRDNLNDFYFDAQVFDQPIPYATPTEYAPDIHAIGAIWIKGIGLIHEPLSKGSHTMTLSVYTPDFDIGWSNTWHITVAK